MSPDQPKFDPSRNEEIRQLLATTVRNSAKPRLARLSSRSFTLVAACALLIAGGVGAALDRTIPPRSSAQSSLESTEASPSPSRDGDAIFDSATGPQSETAEPDSAAGFPPGIPAEDDRTNEAGMIAILTLDGQRGYASRSDIDAATNYSGDGQSPPITVWDETGTYRLGSFQLDASVPSN